MKINNYKYLKDCSEVNDNISKTINAMYYFLLLIVYNFIIYFRLQRKCRK